MPHIENHFKPFFRPIGPVILLNNCSQIKIVRIILVLLVIFKRFKNPLSPPLWLATDDQPLAENTQIFTIFIFTAKGSDPRTLASSHGHRDYRKRIAGPSPLDIMKTGQWKCKSLCNKRVVSVLTETMQKQLIRLFAVNETQLRCCDENTYGDYTLNNSGGTYDAKQTSAGVGVIYDTTLVKMIKLIPVSERKAKAFIETTGARLKIGVAYAPTANADEIEYVAYLKELAESTPNPDQIYYERC